MKNKIGEGQSRCVVHKRGGEGDVIGFELPDVKWREGMCVTIEGPCVLIIAKSSFVWAHGLLITLLYQVTF